MFHGLDPKREARPKVASGTVPGQVLRERVSARRIETNDYFRLLYVYLPLRLELNYLLDTVKAAIPRNRGEPKTSSVPASDVAHEARDHQCLSGEKTRSTPRTLAEANCVGLARLHFPPWPCHSGSPRHHFQAAGLPFDEKIICIKS
ncbi:hypothetical protein C0Q70_00343 [Pomacea canaliculata]|uniref:Uncharacterized protein n=1 Tax=Pomacea canaliculata TaxID=400727 RepID=A0A2T7PWE4_POMCA|nr:hypothetical protein C0Q70_00343 [Pomacea canaliculata]